MALTFQVLVKRIRARAFEHTTSTEGRPTVCSTPRQLDPRAEER
jgi:hypothetical protein